MKHLSWLALASLALCAATAAPQTARDYYNELLSVQGLNPLATFVCFPDEQPETFFIMGRSSEFEASLKAKGKAVDPAFQKILKQAKGSHELLYWQGFHKGIASDATMLERGANASEWGVTFNELGGQKITGVMKVRITWSTLRYKLVISVKGTPGEGEWYGRCEPIPVEKAAVKKGS
jgi:hypothetical protein